MFFHTIPPLSLLRNAWEGDSFCSVGGGTAKPFLDLGLGLCLDVRKPEVSFSAHNGGSFSLEMLSAPNGYITSDLCISFSFHCIFCSKMKAQVQTNTSIARYSYPNMKILGLAPVIVAEAGEGKLC